MRAAKSLGLSIMKPPAECNKECNNAARGVHFNGAAVLGCGGEGRRDRGSTLLHVQRHARPRAVRMTQLLLPSVQVPCWCCCRCCHFCEHPPTCQQCSLVQQLHLVLGLPAARQPGRRHSHKYSGARPSCQLPTRRAAASRLPSPLALPTPPALQLQPALWPWVRGCMG